jgi:hypothetical protein
MVVAAPVGVTTAATAEVLKVPTFTPPERNWDAVPPKPSSDMIRREKQRLIDDFLKDRESATTEELKAVIGVTTNGALRPYMKGWYNTRGAAAKWVPGTSKAKDKTVKPIVDITPKAEARHEAVADMLVAKREQAEKFWLNVTLGDVGHLTIDELRVVYEAAGLEVRVQVGSNLAK